MYTTPFHLSSSDEFACSQVFPSFVTCEHMVIKQNAIVRLREKRVQKNTQLNEGTAWNDG